MTQRVDVKVLELIAAGVEIKFPESVIIDETVEIQAGVVVHQGVVITGDTRILGPSVIRQGSFISESTIEEDCEIGLASQIKECHLGASSKVGSGVEIIRSRTLGQSSIGNQSYVRNSDIGEGSKIGQLCFIDDCTIGSAAVLSAGTITANYDGVYKHRSVIRDRAFVGAGVKLVAPVIVGEDTMVATGSVITQDVPATALAIARSQQIVKPGLASRLFDRIRSGGAQLSHRSERDLVPAKPQPSLMQQLVTGLEMLVEEDEQEEVYQKFFGKNYWLIGTYYETCHPKRKLGSDRVADFILPRMDGTFDVVELKRPRMKLFYEESGRVHETQELKKAISQLDDYMQYCKDNFMSLSFDEGREYRVRKGILIAGRHSDRNERSKLQKIEARYSSIELLTFDDVMSQAGRIAELIKQRDLDL